MSVSSDCSRRAVIGGAGRTVAVATVAVLATGVLAGCTDDDEPAATESSSSEDSMRSAGGTVTELRLSVRPAEQQTTVTNVWGRWPDGARSPRTRRLEKQTGRVVGAWLNRGFVAADYPTGDFEGAFASFTPGAADQARRQAWLTTNRTLGRRLLDAAPVKRVVRVIAFAPKGSAVGATADVTLVLRGLGETGRRTELAVSGELYLTREQGRWRIFGYDLQRSVGAPGSYARSHGSGGDR